MKYDQTNIPAGYDRARERGPEFVDLWMDVIASHVEERRVDTILDLGCGTGRFSEGLSTRFGARVVGLDPSEKMLSQAAAKRQSKQLHYARGTGEAIPVADEIVDVVFMSMSFHHFRDPRRAAGECRRVLRTGGIVVVRTGTREQVPHYPYVPFIPETRPILQEVLPDHAGLTAAFESAGFRGIAAEIVTQIIAPTWSAYIDQIAAGGDSVLARLSEEDFAAGLRAMRSHDPGPDPVPVVEPIDVFVFR